MTIFASLIRSAFSLALITLAVSAYISGAHLQAAEQGAAECQYRGLSMTTLQYAALLDCRTNGPRH